MNRRFLVVYSVPLLTANFGEDADPQVQQIGAIVGQGRFQEIAHTLRTRRDCFRDHWWRECYASTPAADRISLAEFDDAADALLETLADLVDASDEQRVRRIVHEAPPKLGEQLAKLSERFTPERMLSEDRVFRAMLIYELQAQLGRPLSEAESSALHWFLGVVYEHRTIALHATQSERAYYRQIAGLQRLAGLGTLVAGVAHDSINLFLRLHMLLEHVGNTPLTAEAREQIGQIGLIVQQFQNSAVNLRWLAVEADQTPGIIETVDLSEWSRDVVACHRAMLPPSIELSFDIPRGLPRVVITTAALSQAVFNLIRNSHEAISKTNLPGQIRVSAYFDNHGEVTLGIQDNGPGMNQYTRRHCTEPFFTRAPGSSGLGLTLVRVLVTSVGGSIRFVSPPPREERGTLVLLTLLAEPAKQ